jgi:Fe-S cluster assembly protein SufD
MERSEMEGIGNMSPVVATAHPLLDQVEALPVGPGWIEELRRVGREYFARVGLPTTKDEEWRQTNVAPLTRQVFALPREAGAVTSGQVARFAWPGLEAHQLVFCDGYPVPEHAGAMDLPKGVIACSLSRAIERYRELVEPHLGQYARADSEAFTALSAAYLREGAFIYVPYGIELDRPIHLLFISTGGAVGAMTHPRNLIVAEESSSVQVIEQHAGVDATAYFSNAVTEFVVGANAHASHYFVERESPQAYNISTLQVQQHGDSDFASHSVLLGGKMVRNNVNVVLAGEGSQSLLNGLYLPDGDRHIDNHMRVRHAAGHCDSRQFYTGILSDEAVGVFIGRIVVDPGAQKTDAKQTSRNLLLSERAYAHARPQLEIFADDVKCTHGATVGELDASALFYLRSRGIAREVARGMLVYAFAFESLERLGLQPLRDQLGRLILQQLRLGDAVESML